MYIWPELEENDSSDVSGGEPVWFLLYYIDRQRMEMRFELSLPIGMDVQKVARKSKVNRWSTRIILPLIKFDPTPSEPLQSDFADETDFEIKRKVK